MSLILLEILFYFCDRTLYRGKFASELSRPCTQRVGEMSSLDRQFLPDLSDLRRDLCFFLS